MLDEIDSELVIAEMFDEILASADPMIIAKLGYTWTSQAIRELLADPSAAEAAFKFDENDYRGQISTAREAAKTELFRSECWQMSKDILTRYHGIGDDKLEPYRAAIEKAMCDIENGDNIAEAVSVICSAKINVGSKANWPDDSLAKVKDCIKQLRETLDPRNSFANICLEYGAAEAEMYARLCMLRHLFLYVRQEMQASKLDRRMLDFADLEHYALKALQDPGIRTHYATRWKAILIDEFQDTNPVQEQLLRMLSDNGARLTIVGDGKQSIYGFRRADPRVFERFRRSINNDVVLDRTFRTHDSLVTPLNTVFEHLLQDAHEPLDADRIDPPHSGPFLEAHSFENDEFDVANLRVAEGRYIAREIRRMLDEGLPVWDKSLNGARPVRPADIAIICRTRAPLEIYIEQLLEAGIPAVNTGGGYLLETRVAKDVSVLLRFCADQADDIALAALLRGPFFAVDDVTLYRLSTLKGRDECWWELLCREHASIERPFSVLSQLLEVAGTTTAERLVEIADELTGYTAVIANLRQAERRMADWFGCIALLRRFASLGRSDVVGAARYLSDIQGVESAVPRPPLDAGDAVSLMTIHAAKGLEWPIVFVPNLSARSRGDDGRVCYDAEMGVAFKFTWQDAQGKFSTEEPAMLKLIRQRKKAEAERESARILYVAMTRSRDRLYVTSAGKPANDLESIIPGLAAAGVELITHDGLEPSAASAASAYRTDSPGRHVLQLAAVAPQFDSVPVTGLVEYSICPKRFKYRYVDGHPGVGEGSSSDARLIGTLTHAALELSIDDIEDLRPMSDGASDELLTEAIRLARVFRNGEDYSAFQLGEFERELAISVELGGLTLKGKVDLVGPDYVLDFKTDSEMLADEHVLQLWAYAHSLNKPNAFVAYLRQRKLYQYTADELDEARARATDAAAGMASAKYVSTPSERACQRCSYAVICDECHKN
jgi:ATP-dependent helicase/nuclease subunit A